MNEDCEIYDLDPEKEDIIIINKIISQLISNSIDYNINNDLFGNIRSLEISYYSLIRNAFNDAIYMIIQNNNVEKLEKYLALGYINQIKDGMEIAIESGYEEIFNYLNNFDPDLYKNSNKDELLLMAYKGKNQNLIDFIKKDASDNVIKFLEDLNPDTSLEKLISFLNCEDFVYLDQEIIALIKFKYRINIYSIKNKTYLENENQLKKYTNENYNFITMEMFDLNNSNIITIFGINNEVYNYNKKELAISLNSNELMTDYMESLRKEEEVTEDGYGTIPAMNEFYKFISYPISYCIKIDGLMNIFKNDHNTFKFVFIEKKRIGDLNHDYSIGSLHGRLENIYDIKFI